MYKPELAQFVPPVKNMTEGRCEKCKHYLTIDSAYGYCSRFPPKEIKKNRKKIVIKYPVVEWNRKKCGEFKMINP